MFIARLCLLAVCCATKPLTVRAQPCPYGPDQCLPGYVWRNAFDGDRVCVSGQTRTQAASDNAQAGARKAPGSDFCVMGYVWREASPSDHVCVTGTVRAATWADNAAATGRRDPACAGPVSVRFETDLIGDGAIPPRPSYSTRRIEPDGSVVGVVQSPLAGVPDKMWNPGQTLRVRMNGGTSFVRSKVRQFAVQWTQVANIAFAFVDDSQPADIRIEFADDGFTWSKLGRDAQAVPFDGPTMHFGWFTDSTPDIEFSRTVIHEFGHSLGLVHEHQSPAAGIQWDKDKVYAFFAAQTPAWDAGKVDEQVFAKYAVNSTNFSQFDPSSIMEYAFDASMTLDGVAVPGNTMLSQMDKTYIARWYPFPAADVGQLRTNDDCDSIDFRVEHGVEAPDKIRFVHTVGPTVRWWKSIQIPTGSNQYLNLNATGSGGTDVSVDRAALDNSRPVRFAKAKFLGIHTPLGYRWDVVAALDGGSRVTFVWNNDHCH